MIIYNLFPLLAGNVRDWKPHLVRAADMGFDWVFINPIQLPGYSGSLYSIKDYFRFNPLIADGASEKDSAAQFKRMVADAEALGLKLMVDLVVSHCAFDSDLCKEQPKWFRREHGKIVHPSCCEGKKIVVWEDLAQFDHKKSKDEEGLFQYLFKVVEFLVDLGIKGFRCDAAYQVPEKFLASIDQGNQEQIFRRGVPRRDAGLFPDPTRRRRPRRDLNIFSTVSKWWDFSSPWLIDQYNLTRETAKSVSFPRAMTHRDWPRRCMAMWTRSSGIIFQRAVFGGRDDSHRLRVWIPPAIARREDAA